MQFSHTSSYYYSSLVAQPRSADYKTKIRERRMGDGGRNRCAGEKWGTVRETNHRPRGETIFIVGLRLARKRHRYDKNGRIRTLSNFPSSCSIESGIENDSFQEKFRGKNLIVEKFCIFCNLSF